MVSKGDHHMVTTEKLTKVFERILRRKRENLGETQQSLAFEIGIDPNPNSYGEIERGIATELSLLFLNYF
jgi:transcriptional regulator with XRE-family HTH domain